ncbi:MAG: hypothetical protein ISR75_02900 [Phycisphaerales bacterium]|nr:hypothetical protein [Planctomycetota bacterium]MBL6997371.1 hypothetical protein [Phycisphaerales bacterium]
MTPSSEQYAELAAMFTTSTEPSSGASIELLLPAHLPVQGGLWLVPYAGREAQSGNSVLVRMHEDSVDVAFIGSGGNVDITSCTSIEEVIERIDDPIENWIVQPPSDVDSTSLLHCDADYVTLLSGADQAAVVGAYRLLKGLVSAKGKGEEFPPVRLVIVGAEERASSEAASRIVQTAHHQLGVSLEVGHPLPAMGSTSNVVSQVNFPRISNVVDFIGRLRRDTEEVPATTELPTTHRFATDDLQQQEAQLQDVPFVNEVTKPVEPTVQENPKEPERIGKETSNSQTRFASHIAGLISIEPRCPDFEHIELAVDSTGSLHVLASVENFREVTIVGAWATRHRAILQMACSGIQFDTTSVPVQHLFTSTAASVADLHGSGVKLHLLTEVEVECKTGVFCTPLN